MEQSRQDTGGLLRTRPGDPGARGGMTGVPTEQLGAPPSRHNTRHPRTLGEYGSLAVRVLRRGFEAAHVIGWCALDGPSRRSLLSAYAALAKRSWSPTVADVRIRLAGAAVALRFRQRDIYVVGEMLHDDPYRVVSELPARPLIVDAGANIGLSALWFGARYPGALVHCFEPEARCFALLEHNLRQLAGARCERAALSDRAGELMLHVTEHGSDHSLFDTGAPARLEAVPGVRLDHYLERQGIEHVDLLKLDVEGSEFSVLKGLGDRIESVKVIIGECHVRYVDEVAFYDFLRQRGFRVVAKRVVNRWKADYVFEVAR